MQQQVFLQKKLFQDEKVVFQSKGERVLAVMDKLGLDRKDDKSRSVLRTRTAEELEQMLTMEPEALQKTFDRFAKEKIEADKITQEENNESREYNDQEKS